MVLGGCGIVGEALRDGQREAMFRKLRQLKRNNPVHHIFNSGVSKPLVCVLSQRLP